MPAAPAGVIETGAPSFVVLGPEALGLSTAPTDLHLLPDGRILVVAQQELSFGDGVRWETFRAADGEPPIFASVAVDGDGKVYTGIVNGIGRIELLEGERWRINPVAELPHEVTGESNSLISVAQFPGAWFWYGGNGAIVSWRPGEPATTVGHVGAIDRIFTLGRDVFFSDDSSGELYRLRGNGISERIQTGIPLVSDGITCAVPFGDGEVLVGTAASGLKVFNGTKFTPFGPKGILNAGHRITDLCLTSNGLFAASIDTFGIVFFDAHGRTLQVLERSLDHRLARVQRLLYAPDGVLWALLNDGVARVEFPSPLSHYEPFLVSGLNFALPLRHAGELWVLADGRAMHGIYDGNGRLERFEDDTPPGRYLFTLTDVAGHLFAGNDVGVWVFENAVWRLVLPGIINARLGVAPPTSDGGLFYVARGEFGMIHSEGAGYTAERIPAAGLLDTYNSEHRFRRHGLA